MNNFKFLSFSFTVFIFLTACTSAPQSAEKLSPSYLKTVQPKEKVTGAELINKNTFTKSQQQINKFRFVPPMKLNTQQAKSAKDVLAQFNSTDELTITADELPLKDYLNYVMGDVLKVSYIMSDEVKNDSQTVTLNLQKTITARKLFTLTENLLTQRHYIIRYDDNIFYIHKADAQSSKGNVVYGYGKKLSDIPQTSLDIIQMVPFEYGMQISMANTLRQLLGVKATPDQTRNSIIVQGKRKDIVRAVELLQIMDQPSVKNRQIGMYKATFLSTRELIKKLTELLAQEGISVGTKTTTSLALSIVELDKQGELVFFANNIATIERAVFWSKQIDKPILTSAEKYFIYQPMFSRAIDMGDSLKALISGASSGVGNSTSAASQNAAKSSNGVVSASAKGMKMVVDARANSLIFLTSGEKYQQLLPLIKRLDILPKQVMLEVMIAEVKLTDSFRNGVDFVLTNQGQATRTAGFSLSSGGSGLSYILTGAQGQLSINLLQSNSHVNVLSRPTLLVRDGVTATITVGDDVPTVGEIVSDPTTGNKTSVVYRKTGVNLKVKPTINARGVIIMEIDQKISNQSPGANSVAGSPIIFERSISTEVIAESGQTIVLGGLISENKSTTDNSTPFFSSIPLLGRLFNSTNTSKDKTELVVLVTPKIIESSDEWDEIKAKFTSTLSEVTIE